MRKPRKESGEFENMPGHYIRRMHQIAVAIFNAETESFRITPVQWAALRAAKNVPGMDQRTLAHRIGFDTSTIGGVIDRLEQRGLIERRASPNDRRMRLLVVTKEGDALLKEIAPAVIKTQKYITAPLPAKHRPLFLKMLRTVVEANDDARRNGDKFAS